MSDQKIEKSGFAAPVGAKNSGKRPLFKLKGNPIQDRGGIIGKREGINREYHTCFPLFVK
jgi:hypothetical protein